MHLKQHAKLIDRIVVRAGSGNWSPGLRFRWAWLQAGLTRYPCVIGRNGLTNRKYEGDGCTPRGVYQLCRGYVRSDRILRVPCEIPSQAIREGDIWCDDVGHPSYNRRLPQPILASHEKLWRQDRMYDIFFVIGYNAVPRVVGRGSAIFLHLCNVAETPTEGCIAMRPSDMKKLLPRLSRNTRIIIS